MKYPTSFNDYNENYPCEVCSAPCCRYLLIPHKAPTNWMEIDFIRYVLNFPKINVTVTKKGGWGILIEQDCIHFDPKNQNCRVHNTSTQPKTCVYFNPYQCNYRLNIESKNPNVLYTLSRDSFEYWVQFIKFNEDGSIFEAPSFEKSLKILADFKKIK
jgi:hypothetical protein